jgi:tetratricopeptide (TPR) repeat protein
MRFGAKCSRVPGHIAVILPICILLFNGCRSARNYFEKGNALFDRGDYAEASLNYRKALQKDPKYGEAYHRLGLAEWKRGNSADAYQALTLAVQLLPESGPVRVDLANFALEAYLQDPRRPKILYDRLAGLGDELVKKNPSAYDGLRIQGYVALFDHKPQEALELLRRADQAQPGREEIVVGLMEALYQSHQVTEAEKLGLDSIGTDKTGRIYDALIRLYSASNRPSEAEKTLIRKVKDHPKESRNALQLASYYARARRTAEMNATLKPLSTNAAIFPDGRLEVGDFYVALGDGPRALEQFTAGAAANVRDTRYQRRIAQVLLLENKRDEALGVLDEIVKAHPADDDSRALRAALLVQNNGPGKLEEGFKEFQSLVDSDPGNVLLRFLYSRALLEGGNDRGARAQLIEATRRSPGFMAAHNALAELALRDGDMNEAMRYADSALSLDSGNFRAQFLRASALLGLANFDQASSSFNNLLRQFPASVDVRLELALLEERRKNYSGAEAAYKKILESSPNEWRALAGLVQTYSDQQRLDKAAALLDQALQRSPGQAEVRRMLADTAARAGKYDLALQHYQQLASQAPTSIDPLLQIAAVQRMKDDLPAAIATVQKAEALQPRDARAPAMLSSLLESANRKSEAKTQCRQALSLRPYDSALMNNLAFLLAETSDNLDEALKLARRAVETAPNDSLYNDTLGWVYLKKAMNDDALTIFRKLVGQHPDNATFSYHLGMALLQKGDAVEARLQFGRALELAPPQELRRSISEALHQVN